MTAISCTHAPSVPQTDNVVCILDLRSEDKQSLCKGAGPKYEVLNELMDGWIIMPPDSHKRMLIELKTYKNKANSCP